MISGLNNVFKKYVTIFINEYSDFLTIEQLEVLKSINFENTIILDKNSKPFGMVSLGQIHLSNITDELFKDIRSMPNYNTNKRILDNRNLSSYLQYMCDNGYQESDYYSDILMYFIFQMVIKAPNGLINGFINQEMKYLSIKYSLRIANLYSREEAIVSRITPLLGMEGCRKIIFMDRATAFKYLNDNYGFRIAKLVNDVCDIINDENAFIEQKNYQGYKGFLDYVVDYDHIGYGDAYNYILDYEVESSLVN